MEPPPFLSDAELQRSFPDGPKLGRGWVLALVGGRIYTREHDGWYRLDNQPHATLQEVIDGSA
jgi:hypothetical protein